MKVGPAPAAGAVCAKPRARKAGTLWKELSSDSWVDAVLAVQAASASYGTPEGLLSARQEGGVSFFDLDPERPFPGDDANVEYADLMAECRRCRVQHSCLLDERATDTQVWVLALAAPAPEQEGAFQRQDRLFCSFRGTSSKQDVHTDLRYTKVPADDDLKKGWKMLSEIERGACRFHEGFFGQYRAVARALRTELEKTAATLAEDYEASRVNKLSCLFVRRRAKKIAQVCAETRAPERTALPGAAGACGRVLSLQPRHVSTPHPSVTEPQSIPWITIVLVEPAGHMRPLDGRCAGKLVQLRPSCQRIRTTWELSPCHDR
jgi:hypothetical protein